MGYLQMVATLAVALIAMTGAPARAADQPLPGNRLLVVDLGGSGSLSQVSKRQTLGLEVPAPGGPDDPTQVGASLTIYNPSTCESATLDMPASNWRRNHGEKAAAFKFKNPSAPAGPSAVQIAEVRVDRLKILARASGINLTASSQGSLGSVMTIGSQRYCTLFGGVVVHDKPGVFAAHFAPAPASCPPLPCQLPACATSEFPACQGACDTGTCVSVGSSCVCFQTPTTTTTTTTTTVSSSSTSTTL